MNKNQIPEKEEGLLRLLAGYYEGEVSAGRDSFKVLVEAFIARNSVLCDLDEHDNPIVRVRFLEQQAARHKDAWQGKPAHISHLLSILQSPLPSGGNVSLACDTPQYTRLV